MQMGLLSLKLVHTVEKYLGHHRIKTTPILRPIFRMEFSVLQFHFLLHLIHCVDLFRPKIRTILTINSLITCKILK